LNTILFLQGNHSTLLKGIEPATVEPLLRAARADGVPFVAVDSPDSTRPSVWVDPGAVVGIVGAETKRAAVAAASAPEPQLRSLAVGSAVAL
jgi:ABC-type sugar transport system substrate-binding protein